MAPSQSATPPAGNGSESTKHNNAVVFSQFNRKLKSSQATEYNEAAQRLARWMSDPRAYYEEARPWILTLLRTAQATLREHAGLPEQKEFHVSLAVNNPLTHAYVNLVRTVAGYRSYFVKDALQLAGLDGFVQSVEGVSIPSNSQTMLNASRSTLPANVHMKSELDQTVPLDLSSSPVVPHLSPQLGSHGGASQNPLAPKQHANSVTQSAVAPVIPQTIAKHSADQQIPAAYVAKQSAISSNALQMEDSSPAPPSKQLTSVRQTQPPQGIPPANRTGLPQAAPAGALSTPSIPSGPVKLKRRAKRNIPRADILDADDEDAQRILAGAASVVKPPRNQIAPPPRPKITSLVEPPDSDTKSQTDPEPETGLNHGTGESKESSSHTSTQDDLSIPNALHQQAPAASGLDVKVDEIACPTNTSVEDTPATHTSAPTPEPREREPQIVASPCQSSLNNSDFAMSQVVVPKGDETPPLPNPPVERQHSRPPDLQVPPPADGTSSLVPTSATITAPEQSLVNPPPALDTEAVSDPIPIVETTKSPTPLEESTPLSPNHQTTPPTLPDRRRSRSATPIAPGPLAPPSYSSHLLQLPKREELRPIPPDTSPPPDLSDKRVSLSISSESRASPYPRASSIDSQTQGAARPERVPSKTSNLFVPGANTPLPISPRHLESLLDTVSEASGARRSISRIADDESGANLSPEDTVIPRSPPSDEPRDHVVPPRPSDTPDDDAHIEDVGAPVPKEPSPSIENEEPNSVVPEQSHPVDQATEWPNQSTDHMVATSDRSLPHALESVPEDVSEEAEHDKIVVNTNAAAFEPVEPATAHSPPSIVTQLADERSHDINHDTNDAMDVARNTSADAAVSEGPSESVATQEGLRNSPVTNTDDGLTSEIREICRENPVLHCAQSIDDEVERPSPSPITNDQPLDTLSPLENNIEHISMTNGVVPHFEGNDIQAPVSSPPQMNGHVPIVSQPSAMQPRDPLSPVASPAIIDISRRPNSAVSPDDGLARGEGDQSPDEPILPIVTTEVAPFRPGASALAVFQDPTPQTTVCTSFVIDDRFSEMLEQWKNRYRLAGDVRDALSISVVCYASSDVAGIMSAAPTNERDAFLEVLNSCPQSWPVDGRLTLALFFHGTKQRIPMSPPLLPTHDGFVDVSTFIHIGENFVELDGWTSMAGYTFIVLGHLPTPTQLAEVEARRKADSIWRNDLSSTLHRPLQFPPFVF